MAQRALIEFLLFLMPFAVFLVYRAASRDMMIRDRWPLTTLVLVGVGLAVAALVIGPLLEPSEQGKCYQATQYVNGKTIPAKEIPCAEAKPPGQQADPNAQQRPAPVAPRDQGG
jgi:NADH:ubiquinone oxidoreductase subunit 3 (subunit A)